MPTVSRPLVTIGVPIYNAEEYLASTMDALLAQTFTDFEIVISDNGSTDSTQQICEQYVQQDSRVKYHRYEQNKGAAWNFNNTVHLSDSKYFKWAAHDDLHGPEFIEKCVDILEAEPEVVLAFTGTAFIDAADQEIREYPYPVDLYNLPVHLRFRHFATGGHIVHEVFGVIRRDVLEQTDMIGGYLGSDLVMLGQLALRGKFLQAPEKLFFHREHEKRSMYNPQGAANMTQWYDARKKGTIVLPRWKRIGMNALGLLRAPLPFGTKMRCCKEMARGCWWMREDLLDELRSALPQQQDNSVKHSAS